MEIWRNMQYDILIKKTINPIIVMVRYYMNTKSQTFLNKVANDTNLSKFVMLQCG